MQPTFPKPAIAALCAAAVALLAQTPALAGKPIRAGEYLGNGFPSGPHENLILNGKKTDGSFTCPEEGSEGGNVIFMPREGNGEQILISSGRKGPKLATDITGLVVTDACTNTLDGDPAEFQLEANEYGYAMYAVVHGKPITDSDPAEFQILSSELNLVEDEYGNNLMFLGLIIDGSVYTCGPGPDCETLTRYDSGGKGKGSKKATEITHVFEFSGTVCYLNDAETYCGLTLDGCTEVALCCTDSTPEDGVVTQPYSDCQSLADFSGECPADYIDVSAYCKTYEDEWVFNIADFVDLIWNFNNSSYNVQIRAYPLPLQENLQANR
jgi:hypothetical protein